MSRLSEVARHIVKPAGIVKTGWPAVRNQCAMMGLGFDQWQDGAGRLILAKRADDLYAADTIVISIPRQVGKTYLIGAIVFALCVNNPGLLVLWTAHRFKTAAEVFGSMRGMAKRRLIAPHVLRTPGGAGKEAIEFRNGSRILFGARERGFGRGFPNVGVLVFDEAQILTENAMDDMVPGTNTAKNALILLVGTPPKPTDPGEVFTLLRQEALDGESSDTLYIELSADRGCDPLDRTQWGRANPSFPLRTSERAMLRLFKALSLESFIREALGIWDVVQVHRAIVKSRMWADRIDPGPQEGVRPDALAIDMSHEREISIAACWAEGERAHVEEVWAGPDAAAALAWVVERTNRRTPIVIDGASPANSFIPLLRREKRTVKQSTAGDMAKACGLLVDMVAAKTLTHGGQVAVTDALKGAKRRAIQGAGGWGFDRRDETVNIAPIVSCTLALVGGMSTKKRSSDTSSRSARGTRTSRARTTTTRGTR